MDIAGAIGVTTIFPFLFAIGLGIAFFVLDDMHKNGSGYEHERGRMRARICGWLSLILLVGSTVSWIAAIWMGYAQGAVA